jgi:hypothetical protein
MKTRYRGRIPAEQDDDRDSVASLVGSAELKDIQLGPHGDEHRTDT